MKINKIPIIYNIGGIKLILLKIKDKLCKTHSAKDYLYDIFSSADESDYPRLLRWWYKVSTGEDLNLENPQTFNEKIQWLKLYDSTPLKTSLADKYLVRDWVKEKIGDEYLVPLLGVWDKFDDIDFVSLPNQFVLKCNHGSGWNVIVKDKSELNIAYAKKKFDKWINTNYAFVSGFEMQYKNISPKIIAEAFIDQFDNNLLDYKIHVFQGEPKIVQVIGDRNFETHTGKECFLSPEWNPIHLEQHTYDNYEKTPDKPENLDELLRIAEVLGKGFPYVRVDLYDISGKIYFGEMTFTPAAGAGKWGKDRDSIFSQLMNEIVRR